MLPTTSTTLDDDALEDFFQAWIVALTGLAPDLVRPRWQPDPPNIPDESVDWCAFGIQRQTPDTYAAEIHLPEFSGHMETRRHETLDCLTTFYGPNSGSFASLLKDTMQVQANLEYLTLAGMGFVSSGDIASVPELVKEKWQRRKDLPFVIKRQVVRDYAVPSILVGVGELNNEHYVTPIGAP